MAKRSKAQQDYNPQIGLMKRQAIEMEYTSPLLKALRIARENGERVCWCSGMASNVTRAWCDAKCMKYASCSTPVDQEDYLCVLMDQHAAAGLLEDD